MSARCWVGGGSGLEELHDHVIARRTLPETIEWVASLAVQEVRPTAFAGLVLREPTRRTRGALVATDPVAVDLYEAECTAGEGPCLSALVTGTVGEVEQATDPNGPWPSFRSACVRHGVLSVLAIPLTVGDIPNGTLGLYAESSRAFPAVQVDLAVEFAAAAAVVLTNAADYWEARTTSESLGVALESRAMIDQAKGIIMHTVRCGADEAFSLLVEQSQFENRKVRDIATELVASTTAASRPDRRADRVA